MQQLRAAWADASSASRGAIRHTYKILPSTEEHRAILDDLDGAIEGIRSLFRPGRPSPASSLAAILDEVEALGSGVTVTPSKAETARAAILEHWGLASGRLLQEFDRVPAMSHKSPRPLANRRDARAKSQEDCKVP